MKKSLIFLVLIAIFANINYLNASGVLDSTAEKQKKDIYNLKQEIIPIKFSIKKNAENFNIKFSFYDLNKNRIMKKENFSIRGNELFLECIVVNISRSAKAVFPYRIYSEQLPPSKGLMILDKYDYHGEPAIFNGIKTRQMRYLKSVYADLKNKDFSKKWFYSVVHTKVPEQEEKYKLVCRIKGGLEIFKDEEDENND